MIGILAIGIAVLAYYIFSINSSLNQKIDEHDEKINLLKTKLESFESFFSKTHFSDDLLSSVNDDDYENSQDAISSLKPFQRFQKTLFFPKQENVIHEEDESDEDRIQEIFDDDNDDDYDESEEEKYKQNKSHEKKNNNHVVSSPT